MDSREIELQKGALTRAQWLQAAGKTLEDFIREQAKLISVLQDYYVKEYPYVEAAMEKFRYKEGELEVDESAIVSAGCDDGAYVQAWVWITNEEAGFPSIYNEEGELI